MAKREEKSKLERVREELQTLRAEESELRTKLTTLEEKRRDAALQGQVLCDDRESRARLMEVERGIAALKDAEEEIKHECDLVLIMRLRETLTELSGQIAAGYNGMRKGVTILQEQYLDIRRNLAAFNQERERLIALYQKSGVQGDFPIPERPTERLIQTVLGGLAEAARTTRSSQ